MGYISLYRKYRPDTFDKVIGQDHIVKTLCGQVASGNIAHAYLFTGTRGTGKTSVARIFARAINCPSAKDGSPCQECDICKELSRANSMDIIEIDAASNNSIDDIRDIRDKVKYPPTNAKYKVHIIDEVHQLSGAAFNGLLKTLEEPPAHAVFILATTESHKIPQTILSRCIKLDFRLVALDTLAKHISEIYDRENVSYTEDAILAISRAGEGSVRDTLSVADMCMSYANNDITYDKVLEVLGANNPTIIADIVDNILNGNVALALEIIDNTASLGKSMPALARDITKFLRDLLIIKNVNSNKFLQLPDKIYERAQSIAGGCASSSILRALEVLASVDMNMKYSTFPRVLLESAVSKAATTAGESALDILAKIDSLEKKLASGVPIIKTTNQAKSVEISIEADKNKTVTKVKESKSINNELADADEDAIKEGTINNNTTDCSNALEELSEVAELNIKYPSDILTKEAKDKLKEMRGLLVSVLRKNKSAMLSIIIGDDNNVFNIDKDNTVYIVLAKDSDHTYCERNKDALKLSIDEAFKGEYNIKLDCSNKKTEEEVIKKIVELFGSSAVTIKNK